MLTDYAGFGPGVLVALAVSLLVAPELARFLRVRLSLAWVLAFTFGVVLAATITPSREAIFGGATGSGRCDLSRIALIPLRDLRWPDESLLNVLLFVPLGVALGLCPPTRARRVAMLTAYLLPFAIEVTQLVVTQLGRACQSADVIDNLTGLTIGLLIGSLARRVWASRQRLERADRDLL